MALVEGSDPGCVDREVHVRHRHLSVAEEPVGEPPDGHADVADPPGDGRQRGGFGWESARAVNPPVALGVGADRPAPWDGLPAELVVVKVGDALEVALPHVVEGGHHRGADRTHRGCLTGRLCLAGACST